MVGAVGFKESLVCKFYSKSFSVPEQHNSTSLRINSKESLDISKVVDFSIINSYLLQFSGKNMFESNLLSATLLYDDDKAPPVNNFHFDEWEWYPSAGLTWATFATQFMRLPRT